MKVLPDRKAFVGGYEYSRSATQKVRLDPEEVVHLKYPNPESLYYGRSPLQAAAETVDAHESMKTVQFNLMKRGAFPGGALEVEGSLSEEQQKRLRAQFEDKYAGRDNSGKFDNPVPEDEQMRRRITREDFRVGLLTLNEARAEGGFEELDDGDMRFMPTSVLPGGKDRDENLREKRSALKKKRSATEVVE